MTTTTVRPTRAAGSATQRSLISDWWSIASVRWATVALCLFLAGLTAQLLNAPSGMWWTLYLACYVTGGWAPAWEGLRALRSRTLDVDLLMVVAAIGAAAGADFRWRVADRHLRDLRCVGGRSDQAHRGLGEGSAHSGAGSRDPHRHRRHRTVRRCGGRRGGRPRHRSTR